MHDARLYRIAFVPAFLACFVAAFALENRPAAVTTRLAAEAFGGERAFGAGDSPARSSLRELGAAFPHRRPSSAGDAGVADRVASELRAQGFTVSRVTRAGDTTEGRVELETVVGVRPGLSSRRLVVLAHRDARGSPALAELSGTAALLDIARVSRVRDLRRTLVLVSTSGGSAGGAGARAWAETAGDDVDAALVLGDLASDQVRRPWVVPWSLDGRPAPLWLRRTVDTAIRQEIGTDPGRPRVGGQWARRAVPLTIGEQGVLLDHDVPAVLLSVSGERGPSPRARVSAERFDELGRAALRALLALDQAPERPRPDADGVVTFRKVLPTWAVRLLVGALLLPPFLVAVDGFFRVRRRGGAPGRWLVWASLGAVPFARAWAWARLLDVTGVVAAPRAPVPAGAVPVDGLAAAALASVAAVVLAGWFVLRPALLRAFGHRGGAAEDAGGAAGTGVLLVLLAAALWVGNPYTAALLIPATHLWVFAVSPDTLLRGWRAVAAMAAGLVPIVVIALHYAGALGMGPLDLAWLAFLAAAGGTLSLPGALAVSLFAASFAAAVAVLADRRRRPRPAPPKSAPPPRISRHAGPGSLGGTPSALRR